MLRSKKKGRGKRKKPGIRFVKGDITEIVYTTVLIFVTAIFILIMYNVLSNVDNMVQERGLFGDRGAQYIADHTENYPQTFDAIFTFLLIGVGIVLMISSFMVRSHPVFFVIMILLFLIFIIMWSVMANTYDDFASMSAISESRDEFPMMEQLMRYFPFVMFIISMLVVVIQFSKGFGEF